MADHKRPRPPSGPDPRWAPPQGGGYQDQGRQDWAYDSRGDRQYRDPRYDEPQRNGYDQRQGPPPQQPGYGPQGSYGPPPSPKKKHTGRNILLVAGAVAALIVIAAVAGGGGSSGSPSTGSVAAATPTSAASKSTGTLSNSSSKSHPAAADVTLASCSTDDIGYATSTVVITNHSAKTSNYLVTVTFTTKTGRQLGTGDAAVNNLNAGQSSTPQEANSLAEAPAGTFTCKIAEVTRYAS